MTDQVGNSKCKPPGTFDGLPSFLKRTVSLFGGVFQTQNPASITVEQFLDDVKIGKYRHRIERLRKLCATDGAAYEGEKKKLPGITLSAHLTTRQEDVPLSEKLIAHSGLLQGDFDKIEDLNAFRSKVDADPYVAFSFISPSGAGLKVGIRIDPTRHRESFEAVSRYFSDQYGVTLDPKVKEVPRLLFASWDPDVYINPGAKVFPIPTNNGCVVPRPTAPAPSMPITDQAVGKQGQRALDTAKKMIQDSVDGEKLNTLLKAAKLLGGYVAGGMLSAEEARAALQDEIGKKPGVNSLATAHKAIEAGLKHGMSEPISLDGLEDERRLYLRKEILGEEPAKTDQKDSSGTNTLRVGDTVRAADRENYGKIVRIAENGRYAVRFVNPSTGSSKTISFQGEDLTLIPGAQTAEAPRNTEPPPIPEGFTASELMQRDFPEPKYVVPGILTEGLAILAGRPKTGKSWMALGFALASASGGMALGKIQIEKGAAAYLALEDTPRRLKSRIDQVLCGNTPPSDLHFFTSWPRLDEDALPLLSKWLDDHKDIRFVIVDTMARLWPKGNGRDSNTLYNRDYDTVSAIKSIADRHGICILLVTHLRKAASEDPLEMISGSMGISGSADTLMVLQRSRGKADANLLVTGRDIEEQEIALKFDQTTGSWLHLGSSDEYQRSKEQTDVLEILKKAKSPLHLREIATSLHRKKDGVCHTLSKLLRDGLVKKTDRGLYVFSFNMINPSIRSTRSTRSTSSISNGVDPPFNDRSTLQSGYDQQSADDVEQLNVLNGYVENNESAQLWFEGEL
jgi:hypothetical protein